MGTSKSADAAPTWTGVVALFSGRPDPRWAVPGPAAGGVEAIWGALNSAADRTPAPPPLGCGGWALRAPAARVWSAFGGRVVLEHGRDSETPADPERRFERALLETAPGGLIPTGWVPVLGRG